MRRTMEAVLLALIVGLVVLVAGCAGRSHGPGVATAATAQGGKGATASPTPSLSSEEQRRQFIQCMRDHGVDLPDPDAGGGGITIRASGGPGGDTANQMDTAMKECQKYLPAGKMGKPDPQQLEQARQFAQCMRDHGVDLPDPDPNGGGGLRVQKGSGPGKFSPDDPTFKTAMDACKDKLPNGGKLATNGDGE